MDFSMSESDGRRNLSGERPSGWLVPSQSTKSLDIEGKDSSLSPRNDN